MAIRLKPFGIILDANYRLCRDPWDVHLQPGSQKGKWLAGI